MIGGVIGGFMGLWCDCGVIVVWLWCECGVVVDCGVIVVW